MIFCVDTLEGQNKFDPSQASGISRHQKAKGLQKSVE